METGALAPKVDLPSMAERLDELADDFEMLGDWEARYRHLIDLGRSLPSLSEEERSESNKVRGCASQVWLISGTDRGRLRFRGDSDAHIVRGLIAVLLGLYDARTSAEVLAFDARAAFDRLGLAEALSRQRANGLFSMVARIRSEAQAAAAEGASSTGAS
ncbi:MAG: SufE family protein [Caulobacteraceae bacterium]